MRKLCPIWQHLVAPLKGRILDDDWLGNMKFCRSTSSGEISILLLTPYSSIAHLLYFKI